MSCQQVPRITEDPYTFTDTTPTTATLFNPQIHKLTPIIQNTNVRQFLPKKTQIINQHPRIFNTTNNTTNANNKIQKSVSVVGRLNGIPVSITSNSNVINGLHKISNSSTLPSINLLKSQNILQTSQSNSNNLIVSKTILTSPSTKIQGQHPQLQQQHQQTQTLPQIVSLHQSHPLYSVARQTQIVTTSTSQGNVIPQALHITQQQKQSSNPPQHLKQKQAFSSNTNAEVSETFNEPAQKTVIKSHSSGNVASNIPSIPKTLLSQTSPTQEQIGIFQQNQISTQRLPASNFAQPQQIKQLATHTNHNAENAPVNNKTTCSDVNIVKKSKSPTLPSPVVKKRKPDDMTASIVLPTIPTAVIEKSDEKSVFATPPAKRDARTTSTGSTTGKLKVVSLNNSLSNSSENINNNNKTQNLTRTKRAFSQSSHHETLQRISNNSKLPAEWHAPDSYVFDSLGPFSTIPLRESGQLDNIVRCDKLRLYKEATITEDSVKLQVQKHWLKIEDIKNSIPSWSHSREKRIELRKAQLRRQALQYFFARQFLSPSNARKRLVFVSKALKKFSNNRNECPPIKRCSISSCNNIALVLTSYCNQHITRNNDQHLFLPCTAKFSDNTQCRIPVFDITHNLPLCKEHAWKRDNYQRIVQEHKPRKAARKRTKSSVSTKSYSNPITNHKRNKRKRQPLLASDSGLGGMEISNNSADGIISSSSDVGSGSMVEENVEGQKIKSELNSTNSITSFADYNVDVAKHNLDNFIVSKEIQQQVQEIKLTSDPNMATVIKSHKVSEGNNDVTQDSFNVCENSSAYESSEDTGFGALSDAELIAGAHDVIEEIPLGDTRLLEEHDLTNVLNQLPVDAINEFFTTVQQNIPLEPTQEEQEYLERALEMANKQVQEQMNQIVGQQMGGVGVGEADHLDQHFLDSFLVENLDADICTEIVYSPDNEIDTSSFVIDAESNGTTGSNSCNDNNSAAAHSIDLRNLVQT